MDTVYPAHASALARGRRLRRGPQRARTRTQPVTFAEIKEVDEESEEVESSRAARGGGAEERRRRDELASGWERGWGRDSPALEPPAPLAAQLGESRRRRQRKNIIPEPPDESGLPRSSSEPRVLPAP